MRDRIKFLLIYFGFWILYFLTARIIFLGFHIEDAKQLTLETIFGIFKHGIRMDIAMAAYLSVFPFIWVAFSNFIKKNVFQNTIFTYTFISLVIINLMIIADLEVYNVWNFRLDTTPFNYLSGPKIAFRSLLSSHVLQLFISLLLLIAISSYIVYRILANKIDNWKKIKDFPFVIYGIMMAFCLIIPIRGGIISPPIDQNSVYFSQNNFANIAALNAPWNFFSSLINNSNEKVNPYTYEPKNIIDDNLKKLYAENKTQTSVLNTTKPNVVLVILKNFSSKVVDYKYHDIVVTPNFNKLKNEGIYFSNCFAAGNRNENVLTSILSGYPSQPSTSIMMDNKKSSALPIISKDFALNNFTTSFYYGDEIPYMKSYLFLANFNQIIDKNEFMDELNVPNVGVADTYVFDKFLEDHKNKSNKPFFSTILCLNNSNHIGKTQNETELDLYLNTVNQTDKDLGQFIEKAKTQYWWNNTVIIVLSDVGNYLPKTNNKISNFKIPMLWLGGAISKSFEDKSIVSQIDISKTLLDQLKINNSVYKWSKNAFKSPSWAFFSFNNGFGYVKPNKMLLFDNVGKRQIEHIGTINKSDVIEGKVLQQAMYQDYLDR